MKSGAQWCAGRAAVKGEWCSNWRVPESLPVLAGGKIENSIFAAKTSQLTGAAGRRICQVFGHFEIFSLLVLGQAGAGVWISYSVDRSLVLPC